MTKYSDELFIFPHSLLLRGEVDNNPYVFSAEIRWAKGDKRDREIERAWQVSVIKNKIKNLTLGISKLVLGLTHSDIITGLEAF